MQFGRFSASLRNLRKNISASQTLEKLPLRTERLRTESPLEYQRTLIVVNVRTTRGEVEQALISAKNQSQLPLVVVYASQLTLLVEGRSEGEVDSEFAHGLKYGTSLLENISKQAEQLGFSQVRTRFVWENTIEKLIEKTKEVGDRVIDLTQN